MEQEAGLRAWRAFLEAHARVTEILERELQGEKQLPLAWYDVLVQLQEAEGGRLRMTELAQRVLLSKSGLTRLVDRMCAASLVTRSADPDDRRGRWVTLTPAGLERLRDASTVHMRGVRQHFTSHLDDSVARVVDHAMSQIAHAAEHRRAESA